MKKALLFAVLWVMVARSVQAGNQFGVYINEVLYDPAGGNVGTQKIEIVNLGASTVNLSTWNICIQFNYKRFPMSPAAMIPVGGIYTIHVNATGANNPTEWYTGPYVNLDATSDGIGLYHVISGFGVAANMEDFVQFGAGAQARESVAVAAGLWTAGTFVPLGAEGQSLAYNGSTTRPHPLSDYCNEDPSIGSANECGSVVLGELTELRISEVLADPVGDNAGLTLVELLNTSLLSVDLGGLSLCAQFFYYDVPAGTVVPSGEFVTLHLNASGTDTPTDVYAGFFPDLIRDQDSFALYKNNLDFSDPANIVDFFQWGAGAQPREDVASSAGIWTAGDFFPKVLEGTSVQWISGTGDSSSHFCADQPTFGAANFCTSSGVADRHHPRVMVQQNYPNPFNPITHLVFDVLERQDRLTITVYDILGTPVRTLWAGPVDLGHLSLAWDGLDDRGRSLPSGTYVYMAKTAAGATSRKMTLVK